jgi:hypothetical protein
MSLSLVVAAPSPRPPPPLLDGTDAKHTTGTAAGTVLVGARWWRRLDGRAPCGSRCLCRQAVAPPQQLFGTVMFLDEEQVALPRSGAALTTDIIAAVDAMRWDRGG